MAKTNIYVFLNDFWNWRFQKKNHSILQDLQQNNEVAALVNSNTNLPYTPSVTCPPHARYELHRNKDKASLCHQRNQMEDE